MTSRRRGRFLPERPRATRHAGVRRGPGANPETSPDVQPQLISIYALVAMFVVATILPINMGVLAFVGAFLVGTLVAGQTTKEIIAGFPGGLFLTLVGITYLFALAQNNGTIDWLVRLAVRAVRGRIAAIPWIMFGISAVLTSVGAVSPAPSRSSLRSRSASPSSTASARCSWA